MNYFLFAKYSKKATAKEKKAIPGQSKSNQSELAHAKSLPHTFHEIDLN